MTAIGRTNFAVVSTLVLLVVIGVLLDQADIGSWHRSSPSDDHELQSAPVDSEIHDAGGVPAAGSVDSFSDNALGTNRVPHIASFHATLEGRLDAIAAFADESDPQLTSGLWALLDDPDPSVREETIESLAAIGSAESIAGLGYALSDADTTVRQLAIELLAETGTDDALNTIALVMIDPDAENRLLAIEELASVGSTTATTVLQIFLADEDRRVREIAAERYYEADSQ